MEEFKLANVENAGMFKSATAFNEGCIVSIKNCADIIEMLCDIGSSRFSNKGDDLEILFKKIHIIQLQNIYLYIFLCLFFFMATFKPICK